MFPGHVSNAFEDTAGNLVLDISLSDKNVFFWWPDAQGNAPEPSSIVSQLKRFVINPKSSDLNLADPEVLQEDNSEFYRIHDRFATKPYRHCFYDMLNTALGTDFPAIAHQLGGGYPLYNSLGHLDLETRNVEVYFPGRTHMVQEPVFIPRRSGGDEQLCHDVKRVAFAGHKGFYSSQSGNSAACVIEARATWKLGG
ncbi:retinal pigment epithelial membrane protein-domain-containing protein [Triangularia verruculosa]|uniref:Retinal pigment epithelial membrane protein-domain-containing protein n=1 Tax=Triangularia verruculosa TaxID=2587418 RepID=A0AAN6XF40_9PEZI|nr:retinal pigment epithelial membrane protein-domain-containing protein [Triangularia verruculosa]